MSDQPKLPFDPIPVGGTATLEPPKPSFTRTSTELPVTNGLLPPAKKPVSVTTPTPLPPGIAAETPPPNPAAGTPPPNPNAVGGLFKDLFRPTRSKGAIAAGLVSLFAGAYGLNLVMPTQVPTRDSKSMSDSAKNSREPGPSITTERELPKATLERSSPPIMVVGHTEDAKPASLPSLTAPPAPGGTASPLPPPAGFGGKPDSAAPLPAPAPMNDGKSALPPLPAETKWGGGSASDNTKPLPPPVNPFAEKEKVAAAPLPAAGGLPPLPTEAAKPVEITFPAKKPELPLPPDNKADTASPPLPKPGAPLPELPKADAPLPLPSGFGDSAKVVSLPEKKAETPPLPAFGGAAKAAPLPAAPPADTRLVSEEKKMHSLPVNTDTKTLPLPGVSKTDSPLPLPAAGGFADKKAAEPTFPAVATVGGSVPTAPAETPPKTDFDVDVFRVRSGDTYSTVSEKAYGTKQYAAALRAFNGGADISQQREVQVPPMHVIRKQSTGREADPLPTGERGLIPASGVRGPVLDAPVQADSVESLDWSAPGRKKPTVRYEKYTTPKEMTAREVARAVYADENEWAKLSGPRGARLRADDPLPKGTEVTVPREEMYWK